MDRLISEKAVLEAFREYQGSISDFYKAVKTIPSAEPCEDAISRQAVNNLQKYRYNCGDTSITCISLKSVNDLPPIRPQEKTGHREYNDIYDHYLCENCKTIVMDYDNFCPNCGTRMIEPQESEEISDREPYVPDINVGNKAESEE